MLEHNLCKALKLDTKAIYERLRLLEFKKNDKDHVEKLHRFVIGPNVGEIVNSFYDYVLAHAQFREFVNDASVVARLTRTFHTYLESLGKQYDTEDYFEGRLRVGVAHHRIGMSLMLYECAYHKLQSLLLERIPLELNEDVIEGLRRIIHKSVALDISLAIDSYNLEHVKGLKSEIKQLFSQEEKMKHYASIDPLTGVENRSSIIQRIKHIARDEGSKEHYVLDMIDIDNLREVNDEKGHLVGDYLIKSIVDRIGQQMGKDDVLGRYGGDEFLLIFKGYSLSEATQKAKSIHKAIHSEAFVVGKHSISVNISQGITVLDRSRKLVEVVNAVDKALLQAKQSDTIKIVVAK